jgi:hypothetical protein|tara:strand:+ start:404 stop:634 length:231 start_codon:yes stop_codon:yes gene_type:complete
MKNITIHTGILEVIQREPSSVNGNPRYQVRLDGYTAKTAVDSALGYSITNYDGKQVTAHIGLHYDVRIIDNVKEAL